MNHHLSHVSECQSEQYLLFTVVVWIALNCCKIYCWTIDCFISKPAGLPCGNGYHHLEIRHRVFSWMCPNMDKEMGRSGSMSTHPMSMTWREVFFQFVGLVDLSQKLSPGICYQLIQKAITTSHLYRGSCGFTFSGKLRSSTTLMSQRPTGNIHSHILAIHSERFHQLPPDVLLILIIIQDYIDPYLYM